MEKALRPEEERGLYSDMTQQNTNFCHDEEKKPEQLESWGVHVEDHL